MSRPQEAEVTSIQGGETVLTETFDDSEDCGVDKPDVGIGIAVTELPDPCVVRCDEIDHLISARLDVCQEGHENTRM